MNPLEAFQVWAPEHAPWSPWVKPVLFAAATPGRRDLVAWGAARDEAQRRWTPLLSPEAALVLDLPGPLALALALECAAHGGRPVPLFNACPGPSEVLNSDAICTGLVEGASALSQANLADDAAPVFVLDSRRLEARPSPGQFDNRWVVFPQDFPSAARLLAARIRRVILVQEGRHEPRTDLAHVLLRWQRDGLAIEALDFARTSAPAPIVVRRPSRFRGFGYRILLALGLRKSSAGGFGGLVPPPHQGGGVGGGMWA